jgi:hypothetical protein
MKVIDLLNKIANGEKIEPIDYKGEKSLTYYLFDKCGKECDDTNLADILNDEVEIIGEEINKDIKWYFIEEQETEKTKIAQINMNFKILREKLTEIIDKLNEMENE